MVSLAIYIAVWFLWAFWKHTGAIRLDGIEGTVLEALVVKTAVWAVPAILFMRRDSGAWMIKPAHLFSAPFPWLACVILLCASAGFLQTVRMANGLAGTHILFHWVFIVSSLSAGITEEFAFRGFYFNLHADAIGMWPAALLNGVLFMVYHYPGILFGESLVHLISLRGLLLFAMGVLFCWMFKRWKNLALPMTVHTVWDVLTYYFGLFG